MFEGGVKGEELEWFGMEGEVLFGENSDGIMSEEVRNSWLIHLEKTKKKKKKKEWANSSMVELRDGSSSSLPSAQMKFPVTLGGLEIMAHFDSCTDFFILREDLWEKMKGEKDKHRIRFRGVGGMRLQEDYGKKVLLETPDCSFEVVVHPWREKREDSVALVPIDVAERFNVRVSNLPKFYKSKVKKTEDEEWLDSSEDILEERLLPGEDRQSIVDAVILPSHHFFSSNFVLIHSSHIVSHQ